MTDLGPTISPWGIPAGDLELLIARGRRRGVLTMDEVVDVLRTVELTAEVIEGIRAALVAAGVELDETIPPLDLSDLEDELPPVPAPAGLATPPPSVEAELHEAEEAAIH